MTVGNPEPNYRTELSMQGGNRSPKSIISSSLRTPQSVEGVCLEDAYRHRYLLRFMEDFFSSWGYLPALTPVFDYYESYSPLLDKALVERSYKFPDRDGEVIMLRSDITLFLAKQMGQMRTTGPTRVYYADSILRHQEEEDICSAEFFQTGAELLGEPGRNGDLEVLLLLHDLLEALDLPDWQIHLGSRQLVNAVLNSGSRQVNTVTAMSLMDLRDRDVLACLLADNGVPKPEASADMLLFMGKPGEFAEQLLQWQKQGLVTGETGHSLDNLNGLASDLNMVSDAMKKRLRIDLSEHGGQPYYSGFTVKVYVEGAAAAVASGGRYDNLLGMFGLPRPAAGFSLLTRRIEQLSGYARLQGKDFVPAKAAGNTFAQRYQDAAARRRKGEKVPLS